LRKLYGLTVYSRLPNYNHNWERDSSFFYKVLGTRKLNVVDVGARGSSCGELKGGRENIRYLGFDADLAEVERLAQRDSTFSDYKVVAATVGGEQSVVRFHRFETPSADSFFPRSKRWERWYGHERVVGYENLATQTLDQLVDCNVDFLKVDSQGSEFEILTGAGRILSEAVMVEVELEFLEVYEGQHLAHDVMKVLYERDFQLLYLNRVHANSQAFAGTARGQLAFGDGLFGVSREKALSLSIDKQVIYCCLLINYGHLDFAYDIFCSNERLRGASPGLEEFFGSRNRKPTVFARLANLFLDRFIYSLLSLRKTNGLTVDSDRSWPVR